MTMKEKILEVVKEFPGASFVELQREIGKETKGDYQTGSQKHNVMFWNGMSKEFTDAIRELLLEKKLKVDVTPPMTYFLDGRVPNLPVAKRNKSYKKLHWIPQVFYLPEREKGFFIIDERGKNDD